MSKLHDVVEETLIAYSGKSVINVMMFGYDEETEQMINNCPSAYSLSLDDEIAAIEYHLQSKMKPDIIVCANNATKEDLDKISDLVNAKSADTVIIEESEGDKLSSKDKVSIHQNKYEHFTYLDDNTPNIIVYSKTADITSSVGSSLSVFRSYTGDYVSGVSIQSAPLTNVPFTIIGGTAPLIEPDDLDEDLFDFDNRGGDN